MRRSLALAAPLLLAAACSSTVRGPTRTRLSAKQMFEKAKPAIVRIEGSPGVGTGFIVSADGRIATNLHVIVGSPRLWVTLSDGRRLEVQRVVAVDPERDLAVIRVNADAKLPTLSLGDSDEVSTGDRVIAIGNPLGVLDYTISDGLISARRQFPGKEVLQISAPISVGSSGGPLFNSYGEVIGIATFIAQEGQNLNFGMPSNYLRPLLAEKGGLSVREFNDEFAEVDVEFGGKRGGPTTKGPGSSSQTHPKPTRKVPHHDVSVLADCTDEMLVRTFQRIGQAIELGAPVYNRGAYQTCFDIYRGTAENLRADEDMCPGVREALGHGLKRAGRLGGDPSAQAWAMRDAFDGLLDVIVRKLRPTGAAP